MTFTAVILAGGKSSRMGCDKAFLSFHGKPLVEHALRVVRDAGAGEVLVSGRPGQDFSAYGFPVLLDTTPDRGPLGGIERGLSVAKHPLVLVLAVDLPHMTPAFFQWLSGSIRDTGQHVPTSGSALGAVPVLDANPEPLAAFYPESAHEIVERMLGEKRLAARQFAEGCIQEGLATAIPVPERYERCFANWNAPQDVKG